MMAACGLPAHSLTFFFFELGFRGPLILGRWSA